MFLHKLASTMTNDDVYLPLLVAQLASAPLFLFDVTDRDFLPCLDRV
jgi:hypothetical protein